MAPMKASMKSTKKILTAGAFAATLAWKTGLKQKEVKAVLDVAYAEVAKTEKFAIPQLVMLKLRHKAATKAGKRVMFGKEVTVAAKKASKVVKAFPAKQLKDSI